MKSITLKQFKERFYPNVTNQQFSKIIGFDNSLICKIMNGAYDCTNRSKKFKELENFIAYNYSLQLISESKFSVAMEKKDKRIKKLEYELQQKENEIQKYRETINDLLSSVRVMVGAKEALEKGKFILNNYKKDSD